MTDLIIKNKYKRRDSLIINLRPDTKGRLSFYKLALKSRSYDEAVQILMDLAQERINDINAQNLAKQAP
jgi:hypothetical protein